MMNKVLILLASYNGEKFIERQITSILNQANCIVDIIVSDDHSTDNTLKILYRLADKNKNIKITINSLHKGFSHNFFNLFLIADIKNYDYIALSDQDDFFLKNKFSKSIDLLNRYNADVISSAVKCFGASKKILKQSNKMTKYDYLFEGGGQGNSFIMKKLFFEEFQLFFKNNYNEFSSFYFHDWLIYIYCRAKKHIWFFYNEPLTLYRIHNSNVAGDKYSFSGIHERLFKIISGWYMGQIILANKISRLIDPKIPDLTKLNFFKFFLLICLNGRRKISDRLILLFSYLLGFVKEKIIR